MGQINKLINSNKLYMTMVGVRQCPFIGRWKML